MADENYAIRVKFEGIEDSIAQIAKLQQSVATLKFPTGKISLEVDAKALSKAQADIVTGQQKLVGEIAKSTGTTFSNVTDSLAKFAGTLVQTAGKTASDVAKSRACAFSDLSY